MAISPASSNSPGSMKKIGNFMQQSVENKRQGKMQKDSGVKTEQQRVSADREPSRRSRAKADAERARARKEQRTGGNVDVTA